MHFVVDESGQFTPSAGAGCVCLLAVPSRNVRKVRRALLEATSGWDKPNDELKSGSVTLPQLTTIVDILYRHDALLYGVVMDVGREDGTDVAMHKAQAAEGITRNLTPAHKPSLVAQLQKFRITLEGMPTQLYLQCVALTELVCEALNETTMYFAQRIPREIGEFSWLIDAKDPNKVSTQEKFWRDTLGAIVESRSEQHPFYLVDDPDFQYKHLKHNFRLAKTLWRPDGKSRPIVGLDVKAMVTNRVEFIDSRADVLIQAADVLAGFVRRTCAGQITDPAVHMQVGRLQVSNASGTSIRFITLSRVTPDLAHLKAAVGAWKRAARQMSKGSAER